MFILVHCLRVLLIMVEKSRLEADGHIGPAVWKQSPGGGETASWVKVFTTKPESMFDARNPLSGRREATPKKTLKHNQFICMCVAVLPVDMSVYRVKCLPSWGPEEVLGLELQTVMCGHVGPEN